MFNKNNFDEDCNKQKVRNLCIFVVCLLDGVCFSYSFSLSKDIYNPFSYQMVCISSLVLKTPVFTPVSILEILNSIRRIFFNMDLQKEVKNNIRTKKEHLPNCM